MEMDFYSVCVGISHKLIIMRGRTPSIFLDTATRLYKNLHLYKII